MIETIKRLKIEKSDKPEHEAAKYISDLLAQYTGRATLFLCAGGSSFEVYNHINPQYLSPDLTVTMTDDRFSEELDVNNFAILQSTIFYSNLIEADAFCINTQPNEGELLEDYRARFEKNIREWKQDFPEGVIIALYGMGPDGHTGSMIPNVYSEETFNAEFNSDDRLVGTFDAITAGKEDVNPFPLRISTTIPFMKNWVDHAVYYITGDNKKEALQSAIEGTEPYYKIPSTVMTELKDVIVFTNINL
jgi:6-phosphogluconolactonase/glucosamine-6-phosphate isomerase/deaminase